MERLWVVLLAVDLVWRRLQEFWRVSGGRGFLFLAQHRRNLAVRGRRIGGGGGKEISATQDHVEIALISADKADRILSRACA